MHFLGINRVRWLVIVECRVFSYANLRRDPEYCEKNFVTTSSTTRNCILAIPVQCSAICDTE